MCWLPCNRNHLQRYGCNNEPSCYHWFHKECAEAPPEINHHPSHLEHPLLLTNDSQSRDRPCDCCGDNLLSPCYTCPTCEFKVDLVCGMKPPCPSIEHPMCHEHSLVFLKKREVEVSCEACKESIVGQSYSCLECNNVYFHLDCVHLSKEVNHPCHSSHPLKVLTLESLADNQDAEKSCHFCEFKPTKIMYYHCSVCNFTMCFGCTRHPPPLVVEDTNTHKHPLRLLSSNITFTCKICGIKELEDKLIYICFTCNFIVHGRCIGLPQVININRHDHRISFTNHLGRRGTRCGVCWSDVSQYNGVYLCSVCPDYIVHIQCAYDYNLWNGVDLKGIPEKSEDIPPFKVVGHNLIRHFSHSKHALRFLEDNVIQHDENIRCEACICPVGSDPIYSCTECCFVLHEMCANLPTKKRLVFDPEPYTLESPNTTMYCFLCGMLYDGFKYKSEGSMPCHYIDVHCSSAYEPFFQNLHSHVLYFSKAMDHFCDACKRVPNDYMLRCDPCDFDLCLYCVKLPEKILHMSDEHPLNLYYAEKRNCTNWCNVCEVELGPSDWLYTCSDCGVALHVQCTVGDFWRLKPDDVYFSEKGDYKVVINKHYTRPFCIHCHSRCKAPVILKDISKDNGYICSLSCFSSCSGIKFAYRSQRT